MLIKIKKNIIGIANGNAYLLYLGKGFQKRLFKAKILVTLSVLKCDKN